MSLNKTFTVGGDLTFNRLGFGAMRITGPQIFGMPEDKQNSINLLRKAIELGANFIDTADQYGPFTSEQLISEALHPYPEHVIIGTKGGLVRFGPYADIKFDATPQHLEDALHGSLRRLKLEQIELYQLHRVDPDIPFEATMTFLQQAQKDGYIKHIGLSEVSVEQIKKAQEYVKIVSVQNRYSVIEREWEPVLEYCKEQGIAFIPWFPAAGGYVKAMEVLIKIGERHGYSSHQVALSWLLHHAENILLIPGTSNLKHLEENMQIWDIELDSADMQQLNQIATLTK